MEHHHIVSKYDRDAEFGFQLLIQGGKAGFAGRDGSGNYRFSGYSTTMIADNKWHHIAGVEKDGVWAIYVDGILQNQLITEYSNPVLNNKEELLVGNYYYAQLGNHFYQGQVDEVRVWNKALSAEEIRQNMCKTLPAPSAGLVAYFKLDQTAGGVIIDSGPLHIDGRLMNSSPTGAAIASGASIGETSTYTYTSDWRDKVVALSSNSSTFSAFDNGSKMQGFHIYHVPAAPNSVTGIASPNQVAEYYGIFKVGSAEANYSAQYRNAGPTCSQTLYRRTNNAATAWEQVADAVQGDSLVYTGKEKQGEFAFNTSATLQPDQPMQDEIVACYGEQVVLDATTAGATYIWSNGKTSPTIEVTSPAELNVSISVNGCSYTRHMVVISDECPFIPNVITPNGDGKNDTFVVQGVEEHTLGMKIFNRWGKIVYQSALYDNGWSAAGMPAGLYYYQLTSSQTQKGYKGWVEVIR